MGEGATALSPSFPFSHSPLSPSSLPFVTPQSQPRVRSSWRISIRPGPESELPHSLDRPPHGRPPRGRSVSACASPSHPERMGPDRHVVNPVGPVKSSAGPGAVTGPRSLTARPSGFPTCPQRWPMTDKREFQRYRLNATVDFTSVRSRISGMTRDVSLGGLFVRTSRPPYDRQKLLVTLRLADQREFLFRGEVVRTFREPIPRPDQPPNGFALAIRDSESYKRFVQSVAASAPPS